MAAKGPLYRFGPLVLAVLLAALLLERLRAGASSRIGDRDLVVEAERQGFRAELDARLRAISPRSAIRDSVARLTRRGIARLPDELLAQRGQLLLYVDSLAPVSLCAARFMGTLQPADLDRYQAPFDAAQRARWLQIAGSALKEELRAPTPVAPPTSVQVQQLFAAVLSDLSSPDERRLRTALFVLKAVTPEEQCWASQTITRTVLSMPAAERATRLRTMALIEAGLTPPGQ